MSDKNAIFPSGVDTDGHCVRCGLSEENPVMHECPEGFAVSDTKEFEKALTDFQTKFEVWNAYDDNAEPCPPEVETAYDDARSRLLALYTEARKDALTVDEAEFIQPSLKFPSTLELQPIWQSIQAKLRRIAEGTEK